MSSKREFIIVGLKQSGFVFAAILLMGLLAAGALRISFMPAFTGTTFEILRGIGIVTVYASACVLAAPVIVVLTQFDISNQFLAILSSLLVVLYWAILGWVAGFVRWSDHATDELPLVAGKRIVNQIRWLIEVIALFLGVLFFLTFQFGYVHSRGFRDTPGYIINNLRQIDAAKNEFALEKHAPAGYVPTLADLSPYILLKDGKIQSVASERYVLNAITNPPYAVLTNDWRIHRQGFTEGRVIATNGVIYRLP